MSTITYLILGSIVMLGAYLIASFVKHRGYFFWRTFFMSILCLGGIAVLIMNVIGIRL
jgi:branched-subunit amino acid ABC-type transport system permease component